MISNPIKNLNPLVSIVIPVYNGETYLKEAIDSVLAQTYENIEIVVVNDGSTDHTEDITKQYAEKIKYYKKKNGGVATALNLAIKMSKGGYISWLSHDDIYFPEKIEKQIDLLRNLKFSKNEMVFSDFELNDVNRNTKSIINVGVEKEFLQNNFLASLKMLLSSALHGCSLLIPRDAFYKIGFFDENQKTTQDYDLWFKFLKNKYRFNYVPIPLIMGRKHDQQDSNKKFDFHMEEVKTLHNNALNLFSKELSELSFKDLSILKTSLKIRGAFNISDKIEEIINSKFIFKNLHIGDNDLVGNKFNGHDLHLYLREKNINASHLVWNKESNDENTHLIAKNRTNRLEIQNSALSIQREYCLDSFYNPIAYDILYSELFLKTDIVHFHLLHNRIFDLSLLPILTKLKPSVWSFHDPWALGGHCIHHFDCDKWQSQCFDCPYLDKPFVLQRDNSALNFELI